jgi:hypothetical protein
MMPYPVSGSSADRAKTSASMPIDDVVPGTLSAQSEWENDHAAPKGSPERDADGGGKDASAMAPVWSRYIDSRLKQFCTR